LCQVGGASRSFQERDAEEDADERVRDRAGRYRRCQPGRLQRDLLEEDAEQP
jgi:hypothetical protein